MGSDEGTRGPASCTMLILTMAAVGGPGLLRTGMLATHPVDFYRTTLARPVQLIY
jgi:hypothetical protein